MSAERDGGRSPEASISPETPTVLELCQRRDAARRILHSHITEPDFVGADQSPQPLLSTLLYSMRPDELHDLEPARSEYYESITAIAKPYLSSGIVAVRAAEGVNVDGSCDSQIEQSRLRKLLRVAEKGILVAAETYDPELDGDQPSHMFTGAIQAVQEGKEMITSLTDTRCEILGLMAKGLTAREIGVQTNISENIVRDTLGIVRKMLGVSSNFEAIKAVVRLGYLHVGEVADVRSGAIISALPPERRIILATAVQSMGAKKFNLPETAQRLDIVRGTVRFHLSDMTAQVRQEGLYPNAQQLAIQHHLYHTYPSYFQDQPEWANLQETAPYEVDEVTKQVVISIARNTPYADIAQEQGYQTNTLHSMLRGLRERYEVSTNYALVSAMIDRGIIEPAELDIAEQVSKTAELTTMQHLTMLNVLDVMKYDDSVEALNIAMGASNTGAAQYRLSTIYEKLMIPSANHSMTGIAIAYRMSLMATHATHAFSDDPHASASKQIPEHSPREIPRLLPEEVAVIRQRYTDTIDQVVNEHGGDVHTIRAVVEAGYVDPSQLILPAEREFITHLAQGYDRHTAVYLALGTHEEDRTAVGTALYKKYGVGNAYDCVSKFLETRIITAFELTQKDGALQKAIEHIGDLDDDEKTLLKNCIDKKIYRVQDDDAAIADRICQKLGIEDREKRMEILQAVVAFFIYENDLSIRPPAQE